MSAMITSADPATESMPSQRMDLAASIQYLRTADPVLAQLIERFGACALRLDFLPLDSLIFAVTAQQISMRAAMRIMARVHALFRPDHLTAAGILHVGFESLRASRLTTAKAQCIIAIAESMAAGRIDLDQLAMLDDAQVVSIVTQTKGIGPWTAEMFLIFGLNRPNVLPVGDLVLRTAVMREYRLAELPSRARLQGIAAAWTPHSTVATWYLWRSLENSGTPEENAGWWYSDHLLNR